jgi:hypothetical protein
MRDDASPFLPKPGKELTFPNIPICQKWIRHELDLVGMLANSGLRHPVLALPKLCGKKKPGKKKLQRLKRIKDSPVLCRAAWGWFAFRECGWCNLLLCHIGERNSQVLATNISTAAYSYGMTISLTYARNCCGKILKVNGIKTIPSK